MSTGEIKEWVHEKFGSIHTLVLGDDIWFIGREIAEVLKYKNPWDALKKHVDKEDRITLSKKKLQQMAPAIEPRVLHSFYSESQTGGAQRLSLINEAGLYSLILSSHMKSTKKFKHWVTHEVLPSIRKHGAYLTPEELSTVNSNPDEMKRLLDELTEARNKAEQSQKEIENLQFQITTLTPLADYTTKVLKSDEAIPTTLIAKEYGMTAQAFNKLLHELKIIFRKGHRWYLYRAYADKGWVINQTYHYQDNDGRDKSSTTLYWTQYGRHELENVLNKKGVMRIA